MSSLLQAQDMEFVFLPKHQMLRVGITGGIGSGKSTAAKIFALLGIPVYNADAATRQLVNEDPQLASEITRHFGPASYVDGQLNRSYIASIVFKDPGKLALLNRITHPATIDHANRWMNQHLSGGKQIPYTLKEAALIFESGSSAHLDYVIGVYAPLPIRLQRIMQRDKVTREEVLLRMDRQLDENIKMKLCDVVIVNDEHQMIIPQVMAIHESLLEKTQAMR